MRVGTEGASAARPSACGTTSRAPAGAHRLGQHDGEQSHQPGALDLLGSHRDRGGRPVPQDHRLGAGRVAELAETIKLTDTLRLFADEVTRVAREVGTEGRLGGQAVVPDVAGTWKNLTDAVNLMAANLTGQVRGIAQVATAVARGDLSQKITVDARGRSWS